MKQEHVQKRSEDNRFRDVSEDWSFVCQSGLAANNMDSCGVENLTPCGIVQRCILVIRYRCSIILDARRCFVRRVVDLVYKSRDSDVRNYRNGPVPGLPVRLSIEALFSALRRCRNCYCAFYCTCSMNRGRCIVRGGCICKSSCRRLSRSSTVKAQRSLLCFGKRCTILASPNATRNAPKNRIKRASVMLKTKGIFYTKILASTSSSTRMVFSNNDKQSN